MDKNGIAAPAFEGEFADGLEKRQAFNVASGAADLGDHHISAALFSHFLNALFDFIGHVRNHLHGFAEVITAPFLLQHGLIHAAAGEVVELRKLRMGKPFVMAEIQISFRAVIEHVDFAVLKRAHCAGIHIEIGIKLLQCHLETARLKQGTEGGGR